MAGWLKQAQGEGASTAPSSNFAMAKVTLCYQGGSGKEHLLTVQEAQPGQGQMVHPCLVSTLQALFHSTATAGSSVHQAAAAVLTTASQQPLVEARASYGQPVGGLAFRSVGLFPGCPLKEPNFQSCLAISGNRKSLFGCVFCLVEGSEVPREKALCTWAGALDPPIEGRRVGHPSLLFGYVLSPCKGVLWFS